MKWIKFVIVMTIFCFVYADDSANPEITEDDDLDIKELDREGWHAIETVPEDQGGWVPHEQVEEQFPKRRRLRKRKRRPPVTDPSNDEDAIGERAPPIRRKTRPQRLEQFLPWEELSEEVSRKPNIRRRVTPVYQPSEEIVNDDEANINPLAVTVRVEDGALNQKDEEILYGKTGNEDSQAGAAPDLKTLLKQQGGGLSLSEILQQKNLSLAELLTGNQKAISALTESPSKADENEPTDSETDTNKYKRLPPSVGLRKNINRNFEQELDTVESLTSKETLEAQRKRLALLHHKDNTLFPHSSFSSVTKLDVITEPTTEKRIFVPSHPKYYTSLNFKPNFNLYNEPSTVLPREEETTIVTTTTSKPTSSMTTLKNLPMTNAKITKLLKPKVNVEENKDKSQVQEEEDENYPSPFNFPKPIKIDINEVFGFKDTHKESNNQGSPEKQDEPLRMTIDLEDLMEKTTKQIELENYVYKKTTPDEAMTTKAPSTEKQTSVTAKEEIMEIMKDPISRERLSRILEIRNMTIQELVEQRVRGSSQLHLADIFHNKTREPEPKDEPFVGHVKSEYFNSSPIFGRKQKSPSFDIENWNQYTTAATTSSTENIGEISKSTSTPEESYLVTSFPTFKIGVNKNDGQTSDTQPFLWKELYPDLFASGPESNYKKTEDLTDPYPDPEDDIQRLEDIDNALSLSSKETLNIVDENRDEDDVLINIPSGVKSAIFVSLAIVGLSIVVFLTILLVFRWTQRQKTRLNYCSSLSSKMRSPIILQNRPANAIKTFMNETLGRKKNNYYKTNVQSMADDMWDDCRDRKPSF